MQNNTSSTIKLGLSPCPNDTYIFHALLHGLVKPDYSHAINFEPCLLDVEQLNKKALAGDLEISKISLGAIPFIMENYAILSAGAALGRGCGPLVVACKPLSAQEMRTATVAIPGGMTTASLLIDLHGGFGGPRREMLFSEIMDAVESGQVDAGVIIHEGRFTYQRHNLHKLLDLGEWWEGNFDLPLPLGAIVARRDLKPALVKAVETSIAKSLEYARANPEASAGFIRKNAQELDETVTAAHINTFVTDYSLDLGDAGREAILKLIESASKVRGNKMAQNLFLY